MFARNNGGLRVILGDIADGMTRGVERTVGAVSGAFLEPVVRLGVTGLSRSGKTVFITALVANLLARGRMPGLVAAAEGRIVGAWLQPQPDDIVPRFDYERYLDAMTGPAPHWPEGTRAISELRLSLRVRPSGLLAAARGVRTVHLDIVDYPGEWLLDLGLLDRDFDRWSRETLERARTRDSAEAFLADLAGTDPAARLDEVAATALATAFADYLKAAREAGFADCTPGRFLLPGEMAGSPALTFAPLPEGEAPRGSLRREFARRYEAYKREVVTPFFRNHFARIDRQVVLVDVLGAIEKGPRALEDLRQAMAEILSAFRPGRNALLSRLFMGRRVERILFAATKADHLHHSQHARLTALTEALVADAKARADFSGARTAAMAIASLRATTEDSVDHAGGALDVVRGVLHGTGRTAAFHPGELPEDPAALLSAGRRGEVAWPGDGLSGASFAPRPVALKPGEGPPHIRLDRAAQFLFGDRL